MLNVNQTSHLLEAFENAQRIVCLCHSNPDGDAVGSLLGFSRILASHFSEKNVQTLCKDPAPESFQFLPGAQKIQNLFAPQSGDLFIILDSAEAKLTDMHEMYPRLFAPDEAKADGIMTIKIDHHPTGADYAQMNIVDSEAASTCEIVVDIADALDMPISAEAATCLLTGVYTDTGSMMHSNTSTRVFRTSARLIRLGANHDTIMKNVFRTTKASTLRLWGRVLEKISLTEEGGAVSAVTASDFRVTGAAFSELAGVIDYVNSIPGMRFSMVLSDREGKVKGSLRTLRDDVDVSQMAQKFSGGGHKKAAGFSLPGKLQPETRWKVVPELSEEET